MVRWNVAMALSVAAIVLMCAGCGGTSSSSSPGSSSQASFYTGGTPGGTPVRGGTAIIDRSEAPASLDPLEAYLPGETAMAIAGFDQLTESLPGPNREAQPGLAQSWTISPDRLTVTLHIRPGVQFSNGELLTGEDVVYSLHRLSLPNAGSYYLSKLWRKVSLTGAMTVRIQLKKPVASIIDDLSLSSTSIVPKRVIEREGQKAFARHPIGTGPFMVTNTTAGNTTVTMARNPHYWRHGEPYLDGLVWNQVPEANSRVLAIRSGAATIATGAPFSQAASLKTTPGQRLLVEPLSGSAEEIINNAVRPLNEVNVRRALAYAIPREAIIKSVYGGLGKPSNDVLGDQVKYWDPQSPYFPYDLAKAKELLKASSVPNGFNLTITVPSGEPNLTLTAAIEQSSWAKIGVHMKIETLPAPSAFANISSGKFDLYMFTPEDSVTETYDPDVTSLQIMDYVDSGNKIGSAGGSNYDSPKAIALIRKASASGSETERKKLFGEIQELVNFKEAGYLSVAFVPSLMLVSDKLRGFTVPPTGYYHLEQAWLQG